MNNKKKLKKELNFDNYYNELNNIINNTPKDTKTKKYYINDDISNAYLKKTYNLYLKYKNTDDIELKNYLDYIKNYFKYKIYLYQLISSYHNVIIIDYNYYKNEKSKRKSENLINDYNRIIRTIITRLKQAVKLKITIPYMMCIKFMKQIENYNKILYDYIKNDYIKKCRKTIGLCHLPNGKKIYKILIKNSLGGLEKTPKEIHNLGISLLKNFKPSKKTFFTSPKKLFKECNKKALYIYNNIIDKYFYYKPNKPFTLKPLEKELEETSTIAHYTINDDIIYINLSKYKECSKQSLYSLIMHECFHQYHHRLLKYHKCKEYNLYDYNNPSLFEGFAHYMEIYCYNNDYNNDNYDNNNDYSILRKLRLVVDTGINYYGWSYEKAFNYMIKYLPHKRNEIINEIDRYICNPTQALCYIIGKIEIIRMRDEFLKEKKGTIKDFHHKLLINGMMSFISLHKIFN
jgi:uncharacterized protein (DUF885 family)